MQDIYIVFPKKNTRNQMKKEIHCRERGNLNVKTSALRHEHIVFPKQNVEFPHRYLFMKTIFYLKHILQLVQEWISSLSQDVYHYVKLMISCPWGHIAFSLLFFIFYEENTDTLHELLFFQCEHLAGMISFPDAYFSSV